MTGTFAWMPEMHAQNSNILAQVLAEEARSGYYNRAGLEPARLG
jgi:hypothetical protein